MRRRMQIAEEILQTERSYNESLTLVNKLYLQPWRAEAENVANPKPMVAPEDIKLIFAGFDVVLKVSCDFLEQLEARCKNLSFVTPFGDIFSTLSQATRLYR